MTKTSRNIKCSKCGVFTSNADYCSNCGELISDQKKREIRAQRAKEKRVIAAKFELDNPDLATRLKKHPLFLYRVVGWVLYTAFLIVSLIGAGLAWVIAMIAAG
ncbi:hypothetical protein [Tenacibaculum aestuariivivum]|uniref:hypothetical protein n=1 Tax=Tenacibaculum aestuariivivum TaxID=2006131 RepID=UPI003AB3D3A7